MRTVSILVCAAFFILSSACSTTRSTLHETPSKANRKVAALYGSEDIKDDATVLRMTGFGKTEKKDAFLFKFRDELEFTISKKRFSDFKEAEAFCSAIPKAQLAPIEDVLLIAMSGAINFDHFLYKAVTFDFRKALKQTMGNQAPSGIAGWLNDLEDSKPGADIFLIYDGRGTDTDILSLTELNKTLQKENPKENFDLPAICVVKK